MVSDPYTKLAQTTIENYLKTGKAINPPENLPTKILTERAGTFVSIYKKDGALRGCVGTFLPNKENIAQEIITNAISAATKDPRFPPVTLEELPSLKISVDILSKPRPAAEKDLEPKKYGLIVSTKDGRRGLLLPGISGVRTSGEQVAICKRKAGISEKEPVEYQIFTVERHGK